MSSLSQIGKLHDLRKRLLFLVGAFVVFRVGTHIPVPGIDPAALARLFSQHSGGLLSMFNMFSGGALMRLSVFALGVMPYISASIIMQMLAVVVPSLEKLRKEGQAGQRVITKYTRWGTVVLALFQSLGAALALESQGVAV
ncbi:MAG: preprotein translocase subunit SecY, partial [Gammaproteobacteria bacterium]|nr:preprotein translocase subunit SecY [Gammaproteobacteria bacterium]